MPLLSHYTSRAGLEGIAKTKTLWATNFLDVNDKTELVYGYVEMTKRALAQAWAEILRNLKPEDYRGEIDYDEANKLLLEHFCKSLDGPTGSEHLYVTCFARARNEDQESRGILTLWDRFTHNEGYCLQFDRSEIENMLRREATRRNYAVLYLADVHYGIKESDQDFLDLSFQYEQLILSDVQIRKPELSIKPQHDQLWAFSAFATRLLSYCAKHKDPFFEDEREVRIMAVPAKEADSRILTGPAFRKPIRKTFTGQRYIDLGEDWTPGIAPRRIIVGPRASRDIDDILALFDTEPEVLVAEFPLR